MRDRIVSILLRVKIRPGEKRYYPAIVNSNGSIKPFYCRISGQEVHRSDGIYYLRYTNYYRKRVYRYVGTDPKLVRTMQLQRQHIIAGEVMGLPTVEPAPVPKPEKVIPTEPPSVLPFLHPLAAPAQPGGKRHPLATTVDTFVREKTVTRSYECGDHYQVMLRSFVKVTTKTYLDEIDDEEAVLYVGALQKRNLSPRTIKNYCTALSTFLRRYGYKDRIKKRFLPKVTVKIVRAYSSAQLKGIFAACSSEEEMLFKFFLGLGMREREVMFSAWPDIGFERGLFHVTEKPEAGFTIKDKEERLIPIPTQLLADLRKRYEKRTHKRWIFPAPCGQPDGHMLRQLKEVAFRGGLNCGHCLTREVCPAGMPHAARSSACTSSGGPTPRSIMRAVFPSAP